MAADQPYHYCDPIWYNYNFTLALNGSIYLIYHIWAFEHVYMGINLQNDWWIHLTFITMCPDKTVKTSPRTISTDVITWFIVHTMFATTFYAAQTKLSRGTLYANEWCILYVTCGIRVDYTQFYLLFFILEFKLV